MKSLTSITIVAVGMLCIVAASGCGQSAADATTTHNHQHPVIDASKYVLADEPEGAVGVITAREDAKNDDEIVLVGRIGGRKNPWIEGRAAFTMIDASMSVVATGTESGAGQVCLDDCCASLRAECTTLVKVVDDKGSVLAIDARELLGAKENEMVVVRGKVNRDEEGSFSVVADGVYVRR